MKASVRTKVVDFHREDLGTRQIVTNICGICPAGCGSERGRRQSDTG